MVAYFVQVTSIISTTPPNLSVFIRKIQLLFNDQISYELNIGYLVLIMQIFFVVSGSVETNRGPHPLKLKIIHFPLGISIVSLLENLHLSLVSKLFKVLTILIYIWCMRVDAD